MFVQNNITVKYTLYIYAKSLEREKLALVEIKLKSIYIWA